MKTIPVGDNAFAKVDADDWYRLVGFNWRIQHGYAARSVGNSTRYMHQDVLGVPKGRRVDHRNFDRLDNQRENLRNVSHAENIMRRERTIREEFSSRFRGVAFHSQRKDGARYIVQYKKTYLGLARDEESGARMYDLAALRDRGVEAQLNFPIAGV